MGLEYLSLNSAEHKVIKLTMLHLGELAFTFSVNFLSQTISSSFPSPALQWRQVFSPADAAGSATRARATGFSWVRVNKATSLPLAPLPEIHVGDSVL